MDEQAIQKLFLDAGVPDLYQDLVNQRYLVDTQIGDQLGALYEKLNADSDRVSNEATRQYDALASRAATLDPEEYDRLSSEIYAKEMADRQELANAYETTKQNLLDQRQLNQTYTRTPEFLQQVIANPSLVSSGSELTKTLEAERLARVAEMEANMPQSFKDDMALLAERNKIFEEMANLPPIPVAQAPAPTQEYLLSKSTTPREEALAEADRILGNYIFDDPTVARERIADIAQLYGVSNTENQLAGNLQQAGFSLADYAVDPENVAQQRYLSEQQALKGISAFQPTMPQFDFAQRQPFQPTTPQFTFGQPQAQPGLPGLLVPAEAPVLSPGVSTIGAARPAPAPLLIPVEAPVLSPQTAYIGGGVPVSAPVTAPVGMREGGLAAAARDVAAEGRRGDTMLVHMTPSEVAGLQALAQQYGTSLTINPETGLPEAFSLKKFARAALPFVAAVAAPYLAPLAGGSALAGAALAGGLAGAGTMLGGGSFNQGLKTGLMSFGAAGLSSGAMGSNPLGVGGQESTFSIGNAFGAPAQTQVGPGAGAVDVTGGGLTADELLASGRGELLAAPVQPTVTPPPPTVPASQGTILGMSPSTALIGGITASGLIAGEQERKAFERLEAERKAEEDRHRGLGLAAFQRSLGRVPARSGGLVAMAGGGMTYMEAGGTTGPTGMPRDVTGTGDGMSDSVPATIEGVQEARLADGEFVIPADVVADIGNGSSDAGSKKLYDMMDRIRKARHGTTEQPPEINAEALMPA